MSIFLKLTYPSNHRLSVRGVLFTADEIVYRQFYAICNKYLFPSELPFVGSRQKALGPWTKETSDWSLFYSSTMEERCSFTSTPLEDDWETFKTFEWAKKNWSNDSSFLSGPNKLSSVWEKHWFLIPEVRLERWDLWLGRTNPLDSKAFLRSYGSLLVRLDEWIDLKRPFHVGLEVTLAEQTPFSDELLSWIVILSNS